jgi:putative transposase
MRISREGMRHIDVSFARHINRSHGRAGHLFQGRFKAILARRFCSSSP